MPVLLPSPVFRWFVPAQNGTGLVPAAGYKAKFYDAGTVTAKAVYDVDGTIYPSPSNVVTLNSEGYAGIKLGNGSYKLVVTTAADAEVYSQDNISGGGTFGSGFVPTVIATDDPATNGLAQHDTTDQFTWCAGYWEVGDGGHGFFWNETSADADNGGYVIASTFDPTKRWFRVPDEDGAVRAASFGYIGTKTGNLTDELQAACSYAYSFGYKILIGPGSVATIGTLSSTLSLYAPEFYLEPGSMLTSSGTMTRVVFNGIVTGSREQHFTGCGYEFETNQEDDHPEWVGAYPTGLAADNTAAFLLWLASEAGAYTLPPGEWDWAGDAAVFPFPAVPFTMLGSINPTTGENIPTGYYGTDSSRLRAHQILLTAGATITGSSGNAAVVGDVVVTGGVSTTETISTDSHVNADGDVSAGVGGTGRLTSRAGTSTGRFTAGGQYDTVLGNVTTSGTSMQTLMSIIIPANMMAADGDHIRFSVGGNYTHSGNPGALQSFRMNITPAAEYAFDMVGTTAYDGGAWRGEIDVWREGSGFVASGSVGITDDINTESITIHDYRGSAIDWTVAQTFQMQAAAGVAGSITQKVMSVEYFPAYT